MVKKVTIRGFSWDEMEKDADHERHAVSVGTQTPDFDFDAPRRISLGVGQQNIRVNVTGAAATLGRDLAAAFRELSADLKAFTDKLEGYMPNDLGLAVEPTFQLSQVYCPVGKTHRLKSSGYIATEGFRGGARVEVGYGKDGDPDYAIYVHEIEEYRHEPPTRAGWLLAAFNEDFFNIQQRIVDNLNIRLGL